MLLRSVLSLLRVLVLVPATIAGVAACLLVVPLAETLRACAEEWELAFRRVYALARS